MNAVLMKFLIEIVRKTGIILRDSQNTADYQFIPGSADRSSSLHTQYDKRTNEYLLGSLLPGLFSVLDTREILVISEEIEQPYIVRSGMETVVPDGITAYPGYVLVLDPICGSIPYVRGMADYVVSVGVVKDLACVAACIYQPNTDEMFYAERGCGSYLNGVRIAAASKISKPEDAHISIEHRVYRDAPTEDIKDIAQKVMRIRTAGTCSLELCYVACGRLDGLIKLKQSFYDYLPGSLVMEEAGLRSAFVRLDGETPILPLAALNQSASFLATNGLITPFLAAYTKHWDDIE